MTHKTWKAIAIVHPDGSPRHLLVSRVPHRISIALGVLEASLRVTRKPPNTRRNILADCAYLYSWADTAQLDLDRRFLSGEGLSQKEVSRFMQWVSELYKGKSGNVLSVATIRNIARSCLRLILFMLGQCAEFTGRPEERAAKALLVKETEKSFWKCCLPAKSEPLMAPDLTDEEISRIEAYLSPDSRSDVTLGEAIRDYLLWRLTVKLGLRIGEVLALRLCDCPSAPKSPLKVVRVEHRGKDYRDPRAPYAPRPKTRSRDLNVWEDPLLPGLLADYQMTHRHRPGTKGQLTAEDWNISHEFLILSHTTGQPLSTSRAQRIAERISKETGVEFHWHLSRHAYFNRAYALIHGRPNFEALLNVLQYKGGWRNPKSLDIYTQRVIHDQAMGYLDDHQRGLDAF